MTLHYVLISPLLVPQVGADAVHAEGGVGLLHGAYREAACTLALKAAIIKGLRYLAANRAAKAEMASRGILQPRETDPLSDGFAEFDAVLMAA